MTKDKETGIAYNCSDYSVFSQVWANGFESLLNQEGRLAQQYHIRLRNNVLRIVADMGKISVEILPVRGVHKESMLPLFRTLGVERHLNVLLGGQHSGTGVP